MTNKEVKLCPLATNYNLMCSMLTEVIFQTENTYKLGKRLRIQLRKL